MGYPKDIKIIDCMLGIPETEDHSDWYENFKPLLKDEQSREMFKMPAQYMFKDIPGFVLGYEMIDVAGVKTIFRATQINLYNPVAASKFDIPTKGYRILSVE